MDLRCFPQLDEKIRLTLHPCSSNMGPGDHCDACMGTLTVFKTDYTQLLLPYLKPVLSEFDAYWDSRLGRGQWNHVIQVTEQDMGKIQFGDTVFDLYTRFAGWVIAALELAEGTTVEGNLWEQTRPHGFLKIYTELSTLSAGSTRCFTIYYVFIYIWW